MCARTCAYAFAYVADATTDATIRTAMAVLVVVLEVVVVVVVEKEGNMPNCQTASSIHNSATRVHRPFCNHRYANTMRQRCCIVPAPLTLSAPKRALRVRLPDNPFMPLCDPVRCACVRACVCTHADFRPFTRRPPPGLNRFESRSFVLLDRQVGGRYCEVPRHLTAQSFPIVGE